MDARNAFADLVATADERAPGLVRFLAGLRWGGLRTVRPDRTTWLAVAASGTALGLGVRSLAVRAARGPHGTGSGRARVPAPVAALVGQLTVWLTVWRWDTFRWRRTRVALEVGLPAAELAGLVERLRADGLDVQRWERRDRAGGPVRGIVCRSRDLRAVNRSVDRALHGGHRMSRDREGAGAALGCTPA